MQIAEQIEAWRPWLTGTPANASKRDVTGGYVTTYSAGPQHNFTFLTIKGAGHVSVATPPLYPPSPRQPAPALGS